MWGIPLIVLMIGAILWDWYEVRKKNNKLRYISKPLSVSLIIILFVTQVNSLATPVWIFLVGLLLGLTGDILLLFYTDTWFILGLSSFLLGHIAYIIGFFSFGVTELIWSATLLLLPVIGVIVWILRELLPHTEKEMKVAVISYGIVIGTMLYSTLCLMLKPPWDTTATILAIIGASLFVTSDMLLAKWKFLGTNSEFWPMVTYHLAQISIAASVLIQFNR